jgi:hypothetical protein
MIAAGTAMGAGHRTAASTAGIPAVRAAVRYNGGSVLHASTRPLSITGTVDGAPPDLAEMQRRISAAQRVQGVPDRLALCTALREAADWPWVLYSGGKLVNNACCFVAGAMGISQGLVDVTKSDDDYLAFVLAHEMSHYLNGDQGSDPDTLVDEDALLTYLKANPPKPSPRAESIGKERLADVAGVSLMARAGFDPAAALRLTDDQLAQIGMLMPVPVAGAIVSVMLVWWELTDDHGYLVQRRIWLAEAVRIAHGRGGETRTDGLPGGAVWLSRGGVQTYPEDVELPRGLREAISVQRLLCLGPGTIAWVEDSGEAHQGFRVTMGNLQTKASAVLVSRPRASDIEEPDWRLLAVNLSHDDDKGIFEVRIAGTGMFSQVSLAEPGAAEHIQSADVWDGFSRDGNVRVAYGWAIPDGQPEYNKCTYITIARGDDGEARQLWDPDRLATAPAWVKLIDALAVSPGGAQIAYANKNGLWTVGTAGGRTDGPKRLSVLPEGTRAAHIVWTPDGQHLYLNLASTVSDGTPPHTVRIDLPAGDLVPVPEHLDSLILVK